MHAREGFADQLRPHNGRRVQRDARLADHHKALVARVRQRRRQQQPLRLRLGAREARARLWWGLRVPPAPPPKAMLRLSGLEKGEVAYEATHTDPAASILGGIAWQAGALSQNAVYGAESCTHFCFAGQSISSATFHRLTLTPRVVAHTSRAGDASPDPAEPVCGRVLCSAGISRKVGHGRTTDHWPHSTGMRCAISCPAKRLPSG